MTTDKNNIVTTAGDAGGVGRSPLSRRIATVLACAVLLVTSAECGKAVETGSSPDGGGTSLDAEIADTGPVAVDAGDAGDADAGEADAGDQTDGGAEDDAGISPDAGDAADAGAGDAGLGEDAGLGQPPGAACTCDGDCASVRGYAGICIYGECMTVGSSACAAPGSSSECHAGARCWVLSGLTTPICVPDCASFTCAGECDADGSCLPSGELSCDRGCASLCD